MSEKSFKKIYIDSKHSLRITIDEGSRTVVAELETSNGLEFIYAEQFSEPCNYLKTAICRFCGIDFLLLFIPIFYSEKPARRFAGRAFPVAARR